MRLETRKRLNVGITSSALLLSRGSDSSFFLICSSKSGISLIFIWFLNASIGRRFCNTLSSSCHPGRLSAASGSTSSLASPIRPFTWTKCVYQSEGQMKVMIHVFLEGGHLACLKRSITGIANVLIFAFAENGLVDSAGFFGFSKLPEWKLTRRFVYGSLSSPLIIFHLFRWSLDTISNRLMLLSFECFSDSFVGLCSK